MDRQEILRQIAAGEAAKRATRMSQHVSGDLGLERVIGGHEFKPDASASVQGARCARCGSRDGVAWIGGAGRNLCYRHQDDY